MRLDFFYGQFRSSHKTRISTGPVSGEQITWPSTATGVPHRTPPARVERRGTSLPLLALAWYDCQEMSIPTATLLDLSCKGTPLWYRLLPALQASRRRQLRQENQGVR